MAKRDESRESEFLKLQHRYRQQHCKKLERLSVPLDVGSGKAPNVDRSIGQPMEPAIRYFDPDRQREKLRRRDRGLFVAVLVALCVSGILAVSEALAPRRIQHKVARPPGFWCDRLLQKFMSDRRYRQVVVPKKADMHEEYFVRLARGDKWGARFAVMRGNYYVIPKWIRRGSLIAIVALLRWVVT